MWISSSKRGAGLFNILIEKDYLKFNLNKFGICAVPSVLLTNLQLSQYKLISLLVHFILNIMQ